MTLTRRQGLLLVAGAFAFVVAADQLTKLWILYNVPLGRFPAVSPTFFHITYQRNYGLVIGLFGDTPVVARVAPVVATFVLAYLYRYLHPHSIVQNAAFGMVAGGAIGNLIDRIAFNKVVDFIDWYVTFDAPVDFLLFTAAAGEHHWPTFNIADVGISIGVGLLLVEMIFGGRAPKSAEAASQAKADE